ncbi:DUF1993 domain-containing protein [Aurantiacibacter xanthus]|uniref:DUF1993 domain-containing protein n=1 Tax=Aurantiacibacter xanthus TaxID=1784712 RepID=A0A3A1PAA3_9SPHN|nr:DUF1993 domain-containing protein [Aurantiacibacter xanthus]RIV90646.1 DUF1993 domain-containing protein [Aurantiacibacter xanthus]
MPISLHAATVPTMLQLLGSAHGWIDKAREHGLSEDTMASGCLIEDMLPFAYQIKSMAHHSKGAIEGLRAGVFGPDMTDPPTTCDGLHAKLTEAEEFLRALDPAELDSLADGPMRFEYREFNVPFTPVDFLLSFSQPNFFFHATTAYDILRASGVPLGKTDYLGMIRAKQG